MTLNGVIALILRFSPNSVALLANYVTVVEDKPIMSVCLRCVVTLVAFLCPVIAVEFEMILF